MNTDPIIIVEDDSDDCEMLTAALTKTGIKNEFLCFQNPAEALQYLQTTKKKTFLIISDVNMPVMNGLDFKKKINEDQELFRKCIPFVFLSTSSSTYLVNEAYQLSIQGYFQKPDSYPAMNSIVKSILSYWKECKHPDFLN